MRRLGIFGGTFNPIHTGHLIVAEEVKEQMNLEKIIFIPSANPPHKNSDDIIDAGKRLEMIKAAIQDNPDFEVSEIEITNSRASKSFTVDTLFGLREKYSDDTKLYLLIGMDNLAELHTWKDPSKLFLLSEVVVFNRPGYLISDVKNHYYTQVTFVPVTGIDISSTQIRNRLREKKSIKYLVPKQVEEIIFREKIYMK